MNRPWLAYELRRLIGHRWFLVGMGAWLVWLALPPTSYGMPHTSSHWRAAGIAGWIAGAGWIWLAWNAAGHGQRWSTSEAAWIRPSGQSKQRAAVHALLAIAIAWALLLAAGGLALWAFGSGAIPSHRVHQVLPIASTPPLAPGQRILAQWPRTGKDPVTVESTWQAGDGVSLWVHATGGFAPTAQARLWLPSLEDSANQEEPSTSLALIDGVQNLRALGAPSADQAAVAAPNAWAVQNAGPGELAVLSGRGLTWIRQESPLRFVWHFGIRAWWMGVLLSASALWLGTWLRPSLALCVLLALILGWWQWVAAAQPAGAMSLWNDWLGWRMGLGPAPLDLRVAGWTWVLGLLWIACVPWLTAMESRSWGSGPARSRTAGVSP